MSERSIVPLGALAFVVLCTICVLSHGGSIEQDLLLRSGSALTSAGIPGAAPIFSGRDAILTGTVESHEQVRLAGQVVSHERGVRIVDNRLEVAASVPPARETPRELLPRQELQRALDDRLAGAKIEFESGSAILSAQGRLVLDDLLPSFAAYSRTSVEIGGHTDSRGSDEANLGLSRRRAEAVKRYLQEHGVEASRLTAAGYGETRPVADNETASGQRENRRITFTVLEGS